VSGCSHSWGSNVPSSASNKAVVVALIALAASTIALKGAIGAPRYAVRTDPAGQVQQQVVNRLRAQGFATRVQQLRIQTPIIYATRGNCRLSVRDARTGAATASIFASDARQIGQIRYLYNGGAYAAPPNLQIQIGFFETALLNRAGMAPPLHVPLAVAKSPSCGASEFGLEDMLVAA
jgi:hypothetical protein